MNEVELVISERLRETIVNRAVGRLESALNGKEYSPGNQYVPIGEVRTPIIVALNREFQQGISEQKYTSGGLKLRGFLGDIVEEAAEELGYVRGPVHYPHMRHNYPISIIDKRDGKIVPYRQKGEISWVRRENLAVMLAHS